MATQPWTESTSYVVHCIGCGRPSPSQRLPSPFCPNCAHDPKCKAYWREIFSEVQRDSLKEALTVADKIIAEPTARVARDGRKAKELRIRDEIAALAEKATGG